MPALLCPDIPAADLAAARLEAFNTLRTLAADLAHAQQARLAALAILSMQPSPTAPPPAPAEPARARAQAQSLATASPRAAAAPTDQHPVARHATPSHAMRPPPAASPPPAGNPPRSLDEISRLARLTLAELGRASPAKSLLARAGSG